jgi:hypothetical protein
VGVIKVSNGSTPAISDIAQDSSGTLFLTDFSNLYRYDGFDFQQVGPHGLSDLNALAFDNNDNLFGASASGSFVKIDTTTGTAGIVGSYGSGYVSSGDIVFVPTGKLYATAKQSGNTNDQLVMVNPSSGTASPVFSLPTPNTFGFTWVTPGTIGRWIPCFVNCNSLLFFAVTTDLSTPSSTGALWLVDPVNKTSQFVRTLSFNAFGATVSKPGTSEK